MTRWLAYFVRERFRLSFWAPVAGVLAAAAAPAWGAGSGQGGIAIARAFLSCLALLLLLRIVDDFLERKNDAYLLPKRPLVDPSSKGPALRCVCLLGIILAALASREVFLAMLLLSGALVALHPLKELIPWRTLRGLVPQLKYPGVTFALGLDGTAPDPEAARAALVLVALGASCYESLTDKNLRTFGRLERSVGIAVMGASVFLLHAGATRYAARGIEDSGNEEGTHGTSGTEVDGGGTRAGRREGAPAR